MGNPDLPRRQGLYDPAFEHDACGVAFVVDLHGRATHERIRQGLTALCNLDHRGASGSEVNTGDGAGITIQVPDRFLRETVSFDLPPAGQYATGIAFLPAELDDAAKAVATLDDIAAQEGVTVLGWRDVPTDPDRKSVV
jgi:glutamate synthase (NADPH/NADH) large chain